MTDEQKHSLAILVENDLFIRKRAIKDGNFPNEDEMINKAKENFIKGLPKWIVNGSSKEKIEAYINYILERTEKSEKERKKIQQKCETINDKEQR